MGAEYLMLFDKLGNEICASNSFTGYTIGTSESDPTSVWRPVLMGYQTVGTKPTLNEVTRKYEHGVASLITDANGMADGLLLAEFDDSELMASVDTISIEGMVNSFVTQEGTIAAVVNEETGDFVANTDKSLVGTEAKQLISESIIGTSFEGYTWYDGSYLYVSSESEENRTILFIARAGGSLFSLVVDIVVVVAVLAVLALFFHPKSASLCAKIVLERADEQTEQPEQDKENPLFGFAYGYATYLTALAIFAALATTLDIWPAVSYMFKGRWTHGVHLFSFWSAVFATAVALVVVNLARKLISLFLRQLSPKGQTIARLIRSIITYGVAIALVVFVLTMFGVDTDTILTSAGIGSIAIGMGAKDLISDILAGVFIIFEGTIHVGDIVTVGGWHGRVTDMGVRTTEITNESNDVMIINNSHISEVVNMSRMRTACTEEFNLPRSIDVNQVPKVVASYIGLLEKEIPELKGALKYEGVTEIDDDNYTVRLGYTCNEADREAITFKLKNTLQLMLENPR